MLVGTMCLLPPGPPLLALVQDRAACLPESGEEAMPLSLLEATTGHVHPLHVPHLLLDRPLLQPRTSPHALMAGVWDDEEEQHIR